ncbi:cytochrome c maturation protein CcmE [Brucella gallinifaecis]|uniref:Cytochrome c-type biogenesis protein CcmE n=1 Tax=Brucella gallinifaecis TaxID=215590 RepID=A0A502BSS6_9HYPH|nr:cytochrome c maturation protein CcmE [Brucella gallinifaecis]TPF76053.1 cytochrome c maturation protein CcmE [Brucella gallinifaecis]
MSATAENNRRNIKPAGNLARTVSRRKRKRLMLIAGALVVLSVAVGLMLMAFNQDIRFFRTPADLTAQEMTSGARFRLGGLVEEGSVVREGSEIRFTVTDTIKTVKVVFEGIVPDLFREGQGVVAEGRFEPDGIFRADNVLAKHDENYVPKDLADSLKKKGVWEGE